MSECGRFLQPEENRTAEELTKINGEHDKAECEG